MAIASTIDAASRKLMSGLGWYALSELAVRLSRLVATIVLARVLFPADYGLAAAVLTVFELVRLAANNGVGLLIVRATDDHLDAACVTAWRFSLIIMAVMAVAQLGVGAWLATRLDRGDVFVMLALLALNFVALPVTEVRWCRMLRGQRMKTLAGISAAQVLFDNVLTVVLALSGFGVWAVVLPKLLTTPVFVWLIWRAEPWQRAAVAPLPWREVAGFAAPVFAIEVLNALRQHADKLIVGAMLGIELLGVYAFAFNAGLGLGMALTTALTVSLFPHFAVATSGVDRLARFDRALLTACAPVAAILLLQALAALVYVPVVFGERWAFAAPLVALLCASAILRPFADAACQLLRARGDPHLELIAQTAVTALVLTMFTMGLTRDLTTALVCFTIANVAAQATLTLIVRVYAGRPSSGAVGVPA